MDIKILATGSKGNCYHVSDGFTEILIECGIKYTDIVKKLDYNIDNISCVLVSHIHKDHSLCAKEMVLKGFEMIMPPDTALSLCLENESNVATPTAGQQFTIYSLTIIPFELSHYNSDSTPCQNYGYLIYSKMTGEKLLFATDTAYIHNQFKGVTHMLLEVNYMESLVDERNIEEVEKRRRKSHMSLETAEEFLKSTDLSKLRELYAIHKSNTRCDKMAVYEALKCYAERVIVP
jgi:phosphoribosyl 1,2-cyclic phosphodiesterase